MSTFGLGLCCVFFPGEYKQRETENVSNWGWSDDKCLRYPPPHPHPKSQARFVLV